MKKRLMIFVILILLSLTLLTLVYGINLTVGLNENSTNVSCSGANSDDDSNSAVVNPSQVQNTEQNQNNVQINTEVLQQDSIESTPFIYTGKKDSNYISSNELIKLKEGESATKEGYRIKLTVKEIGYDSKGEYVDAYLNYYDPENYFDRTKDVDYDGCENLWEPKEFTFKEPFEGQNLYQAAQVLYRSHYYCDGKPDISRTWHGCPGTLTNGRQIIHLDVGYYNYHCGNRYYEHCIADGSYDAYYFESCDYGLLRFRVRETKTSSEFTISLLAITADENNNAIKYAVFQIKGRSDNVLTYGRMDRDFPEVKFYDSDNNEKVVQVGIDNQNVEISNGEIVATADKEMPVELINNELYLDNNKVEITPEEAVRMISENLKEGEEIFITIKKKDGKLVYSIKFQEDAKFLFFPVKRDIEAEVSAETGEVESVKKKSVLASLFG